MTSTDTSTGLGLKLARVAQRTKQRQVADAMGVSESRVSAIEREAVVTPETSQRYVDALRICAISTPTAAA